MNTSKNKSLQIVIIVLAVAAFIGISAGGYYFYQKNQSLTVQIKQDEFELNEIKKKLSSLPALRIENQQMETELERLSHFIPDKEGQTQFVMELEQLAELNHIEIRKCEMRPKVNTYAKLPGYQVYKWDLIIVTKYHDMMNFFREINQGKRLVILSDIKIESPQASGSQSLATIPSDAVNLTKVTMILDLISTTP